MSVVVDLIEDVAEGVGDLVEGVGEIVGDAAEWVGDTVLNVVESALDDPVKTIAQAVAIATGQVWALPVIEGVDVLEEGGSIEDALKSAAVVYATGQAVSFASDAFAAAGATSSVAGSGTVSFFDDGSAIQFFDDGSRLITDTAGAVTSVPGTDIVTAGASVGAADAAVSMAQPSTSLEPNLLDDVAQAAAPSAGAATGSGKGLFGNLIDDINKTFKSVAEGINSVFNDFENPFDSLSSVFDAETPTTIVDTTSYLDQAALDYAGEGYYGPVSEAVSGPASGGTYGGDYGVDMVSTVGPTEPQYNTMEELLLDRGEITPEQAIEAMSPPAQDLPLIDVDEAVRSIGSQAAADQQPDIPVEDRSISYVPDDVGPPVVDRSFQPGELPPSVDRPFAESALDLAKAAGTTAVNFAVDNPITTAALVGAVAGGADQVADETTSEPAKKTYTYGAAPAIRRTGLQELYSAASSIYGDRGGPQAVTPPPPTPQFQSTFQPLLGGQAPARSGLGALALNYKPMGSPQSFDISTLTPEQIIQLQEMENRRRQAGGGG